MKFRSLLGILAVVGAVVGALSMVAPAAATGTGPTIDIFATTPLAPNTIILGAGTATVTQRITTAVAPTGGPLSPYNGYNASFVSGVQKLSAGLISDMTTPGAWGGPSLCLSAAHSTFAGTFAVGGTITGATNASPIVITTSLAHGLVTGQRVFIQGVTGNTAANGYSQPITVLTATTFQLNGSTGNGAFVAGGTVQVLEGNLISCSATAPGGPTSTYIGGMANVVYTPVETGTTAVHMVEPAEAGAGASSFSSYTINAADGTIQTNTYTCTAPGSGGPTVPATSGANPLCPIIAPSPFNSVAIIIIAPPPTLTILKSATTPSVVAGQPYSFHIKVTNPAPPPTTSTATGVVITDTLAAAYLAGPVTFAGPGAASCAFASPTVTCTVGSLAQGASFDVDVNGTTTSTSGNTSPLNCASVTSTSPAFSAPAPSCTSVAIIPPAVAWKKVPTSGNLFLAENATSCLPANFSGAFNNTTGDLVNPGPQPPCPVLPDQEGGVWSFDEVMVNQGDPNGLGGFSFDVHYDPTVLLPPTIDLSPAVAIFAAAGRTLNCTVGIPLNGINHVACASTGPFGTGPQWVGPKVMAHVTLTPQSIIVETLRPNKENGVVTVVKDDQVTVTNSCGQPLNDGTTAAVPGQPECQGNPLQGVGPGGVLIGNPNGGKTTVTIRRLEGDITKDCQVNVADMQLEASKFGTSIGSLLYNVFFDVNEPIQFGDGHIDILDVQFVFGRFGSTCAAAIPAQPAQSTP